uniref:Uncharacterized protein n=1 Tax=Agrobacterium tumefaciens TaxID=358 RepID=K7X7K7_AGRTU|nr:Hypothetical protein [Agrobacterium radiobacter]
MIFVEAPVDIGASSSAENRKLDLIFLFPDRSRQISIFCRGAWPFVSKTGLEGPEPPDL